MVKVYKPSKFNYLTQNESGELLLYNSFMGSLGKVSSSYAQTVLGWSQRTLDGEEDEKFGKVRDLGFFVPEQEDEDAKLNTLYYQSSNELSLILLPTEQCNFRCTYCYEDYKRGKMSEQTQNALIRYVRNHLNSFSALRVDWFGGEPLVALDVVENLSEEFVKICGRLKRSYFASMTTNAYLLDLETFRKLLKLHVLDYQITIDGTRETHDRQRPLLNGGETFDVILKNLCAIKENIKTGTFKITIRTNVSKEIFTHLEDYLSELDEIFGGDPRFSLLIHVVGDYGGETVHNMQESLMNDTGVRSVFELVANKQLGIKINTLRRAFLYPAGVVCYANKPNHFTIDSDGKVRKCSCGLDDNALNLIGSLTEKGEMEIDAYKHSRWLARGPAFEQCKNCFLLPSCLGNSCPYRSAKNSTIPPCPLEKTMIDVTLRTLDKNGEFTFLF